jgi:hypothetical protein
MEARIMRSLRRRILTLTIVASLLTMAGLATGGQTVKYAGTIRLISDGSFVLDDVGPWRGGLEAEITPRAVVLAPSTNVVVASRAEDGTTTFPGDWKETPARPSDLKPGSFVSVECQPTREGCQGLKVTMVQADQK